MRLVMTGPCVIKGKSFLRADITKACVEAGWIVRDKVDFTVDILVASRKDTVKALRAKKMGLDVLTYDDLNALLSLANIEVKHGGGDPDPFTDMNIHDPNAPAGSLL